MKNKPLVILDVLGISSATLCLIHCLVFPLLTLFPLAFCPDFFVDVLFASIALMVVIKIILSNASRKVKAILGLSMALIVLALMLEMVFKINSFLLLFGGIGMIVGHIMNYKSHFK